MNYKVPNLFLIGAPKSGTTALAKGLGQHPRIFIPQKKEPRYFDARTFYDYKEDYPITSLDQYLSFYPTPKSDNFLYRMDASVFNMYDVNSISEILSLSPKSKFIVILRDPLTASKSMHKQRLKSPKGNMREISEDFCECWGYLKYRRDGRGYPKKCRNKILFRYDLLYSYEKYIPTIINQIGRSNIFIGKYENFKEQPNTFYQKIAHFLELDEKFLFKNEVVNKSYILKDNYLNSIILRFSSASSRIRRKIGLSGQRINFLKEILLSKKNVENYNGEQCDEEVKKIFNSTYKYLSQLEFDG